MSAKKTAMQLKVQSIESPSTCIFSALLSAVSSNHEGFGVSHRCRGSFIPGSLSRRLSSPTPGCRRPGLVLAVINMPF